MLTSVFTRPLSVAGKSHSNLEAQWFDASADPKIYKIANGKGSLNVNLESFSLFLVLQLLCSFPLIL
jgi:hypothetical protein